MAKKTEKALKNIKKGVVEFVDDAKETVERAADKASDFVKDKTK